MAKNKPPMVDIVVRFRVKQGEGALSPEAVIDRLMQLGFELLQDAEPLTHKAIEYWQMVTDYPQFLADAMAWRGYQARRTRLTAAGFGESPKRQYEKRCVKELSDLATQATRLTKEVGEAARRLEGAHQCNIKAMGKVATELKKIIRNPDNIIQVPDEGTLDWCINVLNNPEE